MAAMCLRSNPDVRSLLESAYALLHEAGEDVVEVALDVGARLLVGVRWYGCLREPHARIHLSVCLRYRSIRGQNRPAEVQRMSTMDEHDWGQGLRRVPTER